MPSSYARNLRQIINDTFRLIGDYNGDGYDGKRWTWLEIRAIVQDVILEFVKNTEILKDTWTIILAANTQVYTLPTDCLRLLRVSMHGTNGYVMLPKNVSEYDMQRIGISDSGYGDPTKFYRDKNLNYNQIGFVSIPSRNGSQTTKDSDYGLLRQISDNDNNNLSYDNNLALRSIRGVPFHRSGSGNIIREVVSPYGNIQIHYVRSPKKVVNPDDYPDNDIPDYIHKDIKYGVAAKRLLGSQKKIDQIKLLRFSGKWNAVVYDAMRRIEHQGSMNDMRPL